jgi:hypothetical protein
VPRQPDGAKNHGPEVKTVANEGEPVGRADARIGRHWCMNGVNRHRNSPPKTLGLSMIFSENRFPLFRIMLENQPPS